MTETIARIKLKGKNFEILVDLNKALEFKKAGSGNIDEILLVDRIFKDHKKGLQASDSDLKDAFGASEVSKVAEKIIKRGEIQLPQEYREKGREDKIKQVVDFISKNAINPQTNIPYTPEKIEGALKEAAVNIENRPIEIQIPGIIEKLNKIIPIKIETKKIQITIPAAYTGQVYGLIQTYKQSEEWLSNGDLKVIINIPAGLQMEFYDKLNAMTHGAALTEEIKEKVEEKK